MRLAISLCCFCALLAAGCPARSDTILLANGDRITGTVQTMSDGALTMQTSYAGKLTIAWPHLESLCLDHPLPAVLCDGARVEVCHLPGEEIALADVVALAPPVPEPPPPPRWQGRVDFGYSLATGNRDTELGTLTVFAEKKDPQRSRLSLLLDAARANSNGEQSANRARVEGKLDRTRGEHDYRYFLAGAGYDRVRQLDLRLELGTGVGRTLADSEHNHLTAEVGLSYVRDAYEGAPTTQDGKLRLGELWRRNLNARTSTQQSLALLTVLGDFGDYTSEFVLALSRKLTDQLALTTKVVTSYDSRPVPGTERTDVTVATQLGMTFGD
jgi:putative salt-induced outer membrane protein YdiY